MQIPIIRGIKKDSSGNFKIDYPRNLMPTLVSTGVSKGYFTPSEGIVLFSNVPGVPRGGINWKGTAYYVCGSKLISVASDGSILILGDVGGGTTQVSMTYSFDLLAIAVNSNLFYWDGTNLTQVTDIDLGACIDIQWVDGYFMSTDGVNLVVTELNDPFSIDPLKYGSSEADPDPVVALRKLKNEIYACNRYTIELFDNVGGEGFPFQRIEGAQIQRGFLGTYCGTIFQDGIAFLGSGRNEAPAIWYGGNGFSKPISDYTIEQILKEYSETQLALTIVETRMFDRRACLYVHLPDQTLVYDAYASSLAQEPVWWRHTSSIVGNGTYRARNFVYCYDKWICGDPLNPALGVMSDDVSEHFGDLVGWDFSTPILYNESNGVIIQRLELICGTGSIKLSLDPVIWTSYSADGENFSNEIPAKAGKIGQGDKRITWFNNGMMRKMRVQKFRGTSDCHVSIMRLEAQVEGLNA